MKAKVNTMLNIKKTCDFCGSKRLDYVYEPINTGRGMKVYICENCGLIQSISSFGDYIKKPPPSMSADANRSSVFYTKDIENINYTTQLEKHSLLKDGLRVLDIGSNRGAFCRYLLDNYNNIVFHGVEPDKVIVNNYKDIPNVTLYNDRFENVDLESSFYDLIYCVHTLEHADSAKQMLKGIYDSLNNDGIAFIAVPNTGNIDPDTVLEYFIDTHNYHFNHSILINYVKMIGWDILYHNKPDDEDIILILKRNLSTKYNENPDISNQSLYTKNKISINHYKHNIKINRSELIKVTDKLKKELNNDKLVIWGAGRILDVLITIGRLDKNIISCVIDKYLYKYMPKVNGLAIYSPDILNSYDPNTTTVFIASKAYVSEIQKDVSELGFTKIIKF